MKKARRIAPAGFFVVSNGLFRELAADFAALVGSGVDVDIHVAIHQRLGLRVIERGLTRERAGIAA